MNRRKDSSGLTIVEVLVSVIIISLIMGLLFTLLIQVQKANTDSKKKSSLLIAQNVISKAIEKDLIEIGAKSFSSCSYTDFNSSLDIDTGHGNKYYCVRIAYNETYDISDLGYVMVYRQKEKTDGQNDGNWVMRYSKGYYSDCAKGESPSGADSWVETYSVVQKLDDDINLTLVDKSNITIKYSANFKAGIKYSNQEINSANLLIPIYDDAGYSYHIDTSFNFRINYPDIETEQNPKFNLVCDDENFRCECSSSNVDYCNKSMASHSSVNLIDASTNKFIYKCTEEKASTGAVLGFNKNFMDLDTVKTAKLSPAKIKKVYFMDAETYGKRDNPGVDISYSKNGTTMLYYTKDNVNKDLYDIFIVQNKEVTVYGKSLANMFKNFENLDYVSFAALNTTGIVNYSGLFYNCKSLTTIDNQDKLNFALATDVSYMFYNCINIKTSIFKNQTNLNKIVSASSLFSGSGLEGEFDYSVEFPAYNVRNINFMLSNTKITDLKMNNLELKKVTSMDSFASNCGSLVTATITNVKFDSLESMVDMFSTSNKLSTVTIKSIYTPVLITVKDFFLNCQELSTLDISDIDFSTVEDYSYMFCKCYALTNDFDFSFLSFASAKYLDGMFWGCHNIKYFIFAHDDDTSFNLDSVLTTIRTFASCYEFRGFKGKKPIFTNVTDATAMFQSAASKSIIDFDFSDSGFSKCSSFNVTFNGTGFRSVDISGIHSVVEKGKYTSLWDMFSGSPNLVYVYMQDAEFKGNVHFANVFKNCKRLTFVEGVNFTSDESINKYLTGEGNFVYKNGRSPFAGFMDKNSGYIPTFQGAFMNCTFLRAFPSGYLDDLYVNTKVNINYTQMFDGAFSAEISNSYKISEDKYRELYTLELPLSMQSSAYGKMFNDCKNLAGIKFTKGTKENMYIKEKADVFLNFGYFALTQNRVSAIEIYLNDLDLYNATKKSYDYGFDWTFSGLNLTYGGKKYDMKVYLSNNCNTAKTQYSHCKNRFTSAANTTFYGPTGCSLS